MRGYLLIDEDLSACSGCCNQMSSWSPSKAVERLGVDFGLAHVGPGLFKVPNLKRLCLLFRIGFLGNQSDSQLSKNYRKLQTTELLKEFLFMEMMLHHTFRVVSADTEMSWTTLLLLSWRRLGEKERSETNRSCEMRDVISWDVAASQSL